jgi:hypothetical protein
LTALGFEPIQDIFHSEYNWQENEEKEKEKVTHCEWIQVFAKGGFTLDLNPYNEE